MATIPSTTYSKDFNTSPNWAVKNNKNVSANKTVECGCICDGMQRAPDAYTVKITSKPVNISGGERIIINSLLQNTTNMRVTSQWGPLSPMGALTSIADVTAQALFKKSLQTRYTSRRIWKGTSPVTITLPLKFMAVRNGWKDVVQPSMYLQRMALPSLGSDFKGDEGPFSALLVPPGPSPFNVEDIVEADRLKNTGLGKSLATGWNTKVEVGKFLVFDNVIVKDVSVTFGSRMMSSGHPTESNVEVIFETYEIVTKKVLENDVYQKGSFGDIGANIGALL